jgi:hypothetical protein
MIPVRDKTPAAAARKRACWPAIKATGSMTSSVAITPET